MKKVAIIAIVASVASLAVACKSESEKASGWNVRASSSIPPRNPRRSSNITPPGPARYDHPKQRS